jgi:hypothetical protein
VDKRKTESAKRSSKRQTNNKLGKVAAALRTKPAGFDAEDVSKLPTTVNQEVPIIFQLLLVIFSINTEIPSIFMYI